MPEIKVKKLRKCRRCGGPAPYDAEERIYKCKSCGYEEMDRRRREEFVESHKKEIIRDILTIGSAKTRAKWGILRTSFSHLTPRWGLCKVWSAPGMTSPSTNGLPKLPAWREEWTPEFKMLWLSTLHALVKSQEVKE